MLVASDEITSKSWEAVAKGKGDGFFHARYTPLLFPIGYFSLSPAQASIVVSLTFLVSSECPSVSSVLLFTYLRTLRLFSTLVL